LKFFQNIWGIFFGNFFFKKRKENENTNPTFSPFDQDVNVIRSNIDYINGSNLDK
jgi:hypothetical protein